MSLTVPEAIYSRGPIRLITGAGALKHHPARYVVVAGAVLLVVLLPPMYSLVLLIGLAVLSYLLARPFFTLCTLAFAVPFEQVRSLSAGGLNVTITNLIVFCLAAAWVGRSVVSGRLQLGPAPWRLALLLYGLVLIVSVTQATSYVASLKELLKWGQLLFVYLAGVSIVRTRGQMRTLLIVLFAAVIAESLVGVGQTFLHSGPSSFSRGAILRSAGTFQQPNPFAGYLNMTLPLAVACLIFRVFPRKYMWWVTLIIGAGVLSSLSRGAWLGALAALIVIGAIITPHIRSLVAMAGVGVAAVICLVYMGILPYTVTNPFFEQLGIADINIANPTPDNWSVAERLAHMESGLAMFADHPVLGVGIGNYPDAYPKYQQPGPWGPALGHAHNYYINIAAEAGAFGFVAFVALLSSAMVICVRSYRRARDDLSRALALGGLGVIVAFAVHMFFDDLLVHSMEVQIALVMVLATLAGQGLSRIVSRPEDVLA